jgi:SAM-dependent methyltransferase
MYQTLKNIITKIIPKKIIFEKEETLRSIYSLYYTGQNYQCNICKKKLSKFILTSDSDSLCPNCGSLKRNRRLWSLLETEFLFPNAKVLDFSPSRCLYRKMKKLGTINYLSTDLSGDFIADHQFDITNLNIADNSIDLIICYHILEHIDDDIQAMKELYRVLKPEGKIIIQTPFKEGDTYENPKITKPEERVIHFGQEDHVRIYSVDGLKERLMNVGFHVKVCTYDKTNTYNDLIENETVLIATKI